MRIERLCILGVGLIGGSLALALKRAARVARVVGCGRRESALKRGVELGVIDEYSTDPARAVRGADVVVLATPLGAVRRMLELIAPHLDPEALLTDVGSAKRCVIEDAREVFGELPTRFVPGHPIAGTERSGVEAAFATLFDGRRVILTPVAETSAAAVTTLTGLWESAGAEVVNLDPDHHDQVLAATSHLPHMLAYTLVDSLGRMDERAEVFRYAAGGFRDFTRIASSDPTMWHDICLANSDALLKSLARFRHDLDHVIESIRDADSEALKQVFTRAKSLRDAYIDKSR